MSTAASTHRLLLGMLAAALAAPGWSADCAARSGVTRTPVIELYTSEGCSSCPPADRWLSTLKRAAADGKAVVQAFHVGYWDYIGWVDRFATAAHTARQRAVAARNGQSSIYTPQLVRDGRDWRDWGGNPAQATAAAPEAALATIAIERTGSGPQGDRFEADVAPLADPAAGWSAYWSITEHGHRSKVGAGENAGAVLQHDFVVRQYVPAGEYQGAAHLSLYGIVADPAHARQVNLVVVDSKSGRPLQALSLICAAG